MAARILPEHAPPLRAHASTDTGVERAHLDTTLPIRGRGRTIAADGGVALFIICDLAPGRGVAEAVAEDLADHDAIRPAGVVEDAIDFIDRESRGGIESGQHEDRDNDGDAAHHDLLLAPERYTSIRPEASGAMARPPRASATRAWTVRRVFLSVSRRCGCV